MFFLVHVAATWVDSLIYMLIPGANSYFVGLSIVLGVGTFGGMGIVLGPLLIGTLVTMIDIYKDFTLKPRRTETVITSWDALASPLRTFSNLLQAPVSAPASNRRK